MHPSHFGYQLSAVATGSIVGQGSNPARLAKGVAGFWTRRGFRPTADIVSAIDDSAKPLGYWLSAIRPVRASALTGRGPNDL
jgi:hypothetical protein